uniref:Nnf1 n=1 Tax=Musca domestica TaxID=7370 RepID=T1PLG2_MUSDO
MSAAIVQKSNTTTTTKTSSNTAIYFDCGDIFTTNKSIDKPLQSHHLSNGHINGGNSITELNIMDIACSNNSSMDHMDQMDQLQQNTNTTNNASQTKALNHPTYRLHAALTRTISTPQPQIKPPTATAAHHLNHLQQQQQQQLQVQASNKHGWSLLTWRG